MSKALPTILIIPTGIGCALGGFAGDAIPTARLLASASGCLITHPNVLNGASLYWPDKRIEYVEGFALDLFSTGAISLRPVREQRIGILLDSGLETDLKTRHLQVADSCRTTLGLNIGPVAYTEFPLSIELSQGVSGASWGNIREPHILINAAKKLINLGATAIAIISRFPDDENSEQLDSYRKGKGVDALSGAEAIISHLIMKHCLVPCAHTPGLLPLPLDKDLDPRSMAEEIGHTFLPSVLVGLSRAPDLVPLEMDQNINAISPRNHDPTDIRIDQIGAVVIPDSAFGGETVMACMERNIPVVAVSNPCVLSVNAKSLGLDLSNEGGNEFKVIHASNYVEAAGILLSLREGINLSSLKRPIQSIFKTN